MAWAWRMSARARSGELQTELSQRCRFATKLRQGAFAKQPRSQRCDRIGPLRRADQTAAPRTDASHCARPNDGRQQPGAQERGLAGAAHAIDEQECLAIGGLLLEASHAVGDRPGSSEEEVSVFKFEGVETSKRRGHLLFGRERHAVGVHRPGDVLHPLLAKIDEFEREPIAGLCVDRFRNAYSTRR